jgi:hypothetical protein
MKPNFVPPKFMGKRVLAIDDLKTGRAQIFEDEDGVEHVIVHLRRSSLIRRSRNRLTQHQASARLQRRQHSLQHGDALGHLMVRVHDKRGVERNAGKMRIVFCADDDGDVRDVRIGQATAQTSENLFIDVDGVDPATWSDR